MLRCCKNSPGDLGVLFFLRLVELNRLWQRHTKKKKKKISLRFLYLDFFKVLIVLGLHILDLILQFMNFLVKRAAAVSKGSVK